MCNGVIYLVLFIAFLIPILQSLSQLKYLSTIKPGLIIYVAIELAIYGVQAVLSFLMIACLKNHFFYIIFDRYFGNLLSAVIFANMIFGCTQFWN
jgi:hypothetical protein